MMSAATAIRTLENRHAELKRTYMIRARRNRPSAKSVSVRLLSKMWSDDPQLSTRSRVYRLTWEYDLVRAVTTSPNAADKAYLLSEQEAQQRIIVSIDEQGYDVYA